MLADLDNRLASSIDRAAAAVLAGRRELDEIRMQIHNAASSVPPTELKQELLTRISQQGTRDVTDVLRRSDSEIRTIAGQIKAIGDEYPKSNQKYDAPDPVPKIPTDKIVPGTPVRPFEGVLSDEEWRIARLSPTLLDEWTQANSEGWKFTSNPGVGTYTDSRKKVINIDPDLADNGPFQRVNALSHELGHALKNPPIDRSSKEAFVNSRLDGEGAATMNTMKIEREILDAGGPEIIPPGVNDDKFKQIYDTYIQSGSTKDAYQVAIRQIGGIYGDLIPSTDPSTTYREYYGRDYK